jgi:hypothetical protein
LKTGYELLRSERLQWLPELGLGWYPVPADAQPYDRHYWDRYLGMDMTDTGRALTEARMSMVAKYWDGPLVDIGIGGGRFVRERRETLGYDINPRAREWLKLEGLWFDPYASQAPAMSCWDSMEHIADPAPLLRNVTNLLFLSLPIFDGPTHVLRSRHYRRDEHYWYFTAHGLDLFMALHGFECLEANTMEQDCGREDIGSFVFKRIA